MALALNSKTGCFDCRRRRVKCDETHPSCLRCRKMGIPCVWLKRVTIPSAYMQFNTTMGNTYAHLFLQDENVDYQPPLPYVELQSCPSRNISPGHAQFRNEQEHSDLVRLSSFLSMLSLDRQSEKAYNTKFEFTVALQEPWVRDALLAFAGFINVSRDRATIWNNVLPYYLSATKSVQAYLLQQLDEARLEQLLIASQFLGMIEITNPQNQTFPLLHFEAVGRILEVLHDLQKDKTLSPATERFHRIALESYFYHIALQSLFYPQTDRYTTIPQIFEPHHGITTTSAESNIIVKLDLRIYTVLLRLTRLGRVKELNAEQRAQAADLNGTVQKLAKEASAELAQPAESSKNTSFAEMTLLGTIALTILGEKVQNRSLLAKARALRPPVEDLLRRLEMVRPSRQWTGDFVWILTVAACAVYTHSECQKFKKIVQQLSPGFWGSDLLRMKAVLKLVKCRRAALIVEVTKNDAMDDRVGDTLSLLIDGGISSGKTTTLLPKHYLSLNSLEDGALISAFYYFNAGAYVEFKTSLRAIDALLCTSLVSGCTDVDCKNNLSNVKMNYRTSWP